MMMMMMICFGFLIVFVQYWFSYTVSDVYAVWCFKAYINLIFVSLLCALKLKLAYHHDHYFFFHFVISSPCYNCAWMGGIHIYIYKYSTFKV